jgi:hypothetical protein
MAYQLVECPSSSLVHDAEKATIDAKINAQICLAIQLTSIVHVLKK